MLRMMKVERLIWVPLSTLASCIQLVDLVCLTCQNGLGVCAQWWTVGWVPGLANVLCGIHASMSACPIQVHGGTGAYPGSQSWSIWPKMSSSYKCSCQSLSIIITITVKPLFLSTLKADFYSWVKIEETRLIVVINYSLSSDKRLSNSSNGKDDASGTLCSIFWPH